MVAGESATTNRCGFWEFTLFILAVITGTACSICSKTMMELHGIGKDGDEEMFTKPIFQTFGMFVGMLFGLVMHEVVLAFKIPFPRIRPWDHNDVVVRKWPKQQQQTTCLWQYRRNQGFS